MGFMWIRKLIKDFILIRIFIVFVNFYFSGSPNSSRNQEVAINMSSSEIAAVA